ncbi:L,D-transpeptidase family protein [Metabacillus arenae]|uniref:L,D-transpeptidase family protein n=1 Tax=Metabacillus arenae TaxID=2771434 RepID=A0A926S0L1_9BACI|nr:L,D-transpeptidase family protein [Metabacillus arenae]MBD1380119.1 L,D-transpeptidase family protein [Metabacillus arenae]
MRKIFILISLFFLFFFGAGMTKASAGGKQLIIINKAKNELAYYEGSSLKSVFKVATGRKPSYTPEGRFKIVNKIVNRPYYKKKIRGGDPRNPLGNRWLGINARGTWGTTYAIHGNNNPSSIGKYVSDGCIRMFDHEVEWLFSKVKVNTPVIITTSNKSFQSIAYSNGYKVNGSNKQVSKPAVTTGTMLKKGHRGSEVKELQRLLTNKGYSTKGIDGIYGSNTDKAVRKFQKDRKLKVDGVVGPATKKALGLF